MTSLTKALKDETARIARKEIRAEAVAARQISGKYRKEVAELKRRIGSLEKEIGVLRRHEGRRAFQKPAMELADGARFTPNWVKTHRKKLALSAADYAALIGVHAMTIYNWEHGRSKPRRSQLAALVSIRKLSRREALKRLNLA